MDLLSITAATQKTGFQLTLRNLSGQRGGNGDKVQVSAPIVDGHLPALPKVVGVGVALRHEQIQRKAPVHQNPCRCQAKNYNGGTRRVGKLLTEKEMIRQEVDQVNSYQLLCTDQTPNRLGQEQRHYQCVCPLHRSWSCKRRCDPGKQRD